MKTRRHHNNKGLRQIKNGKTREFVNKLGGALGIPARDSEVNDSRTDAEKTSQQAFEVK
jgi:hypothetical protein